MTPASWSNMVKETRRLEKALGDGIKKVDQMKESIIVQRRSIKANKILKKGSLLNKKNICF